MAESYAGEVRGGVVVFDPGTPPLPDGMRVQVTAQEVAEPAEAEGPSLYERLRPIIGAVKGLPEDLAEQHDHYIHGTPKR